jgi:RHS repeat-associated protein
LFSFQYHQNTSPSTTEKTFVEYIIRDGNCEDNVSNCTVTTTNYTKHISKITCHETGEWIEFVQGQLREDVITDHYLDYINVYSNSNTISYSFDFSYSYFLSIDGSSTKRLKLTDCKFIDSNGEAQQPSIFEYNEDFSLPAYNSYKVDHWGFYNGNFRAGDIDYDSPLNSINSPRTPKLEFASSSIVKSITSPTGAKTSFSYELSSYSENSQGLVNNSVVTREISADQSFAITLQPRYSEYFEINNEFSGLYSFTIGIMHPDCDNVDAKVAVCKYDDGGGEIIVHEYIQCTSGSILVDFELVPGTYRLMAWSGLSSCAICDFGPTASISVNIPFHEGPTPTIRLGGGLRISEIRTSDGDEDNSNDIVKKYSYVDAIDSSRSSGYLISTPDYYQYQSSGLIILDDPATGNGGLNCTDDDTYSIFLDYHHECNLNLWSSTSKVPLLAAGGGYVIYKNVKETICNASSICENGFVMNYFTIEPAPSVNKNIGQGEYFKHWRAGLPLKTQIYKQDGHLIGETINTYEDLAVVAFSSRLIGGVKQSIWETNFGEQYPTCGLWNLYDAVVEDIPSEIYSLTNTVQRLFDQNDPSKFSETSVEYVYSSWVGGIPSDVITRTNDPINPIVIEHTQYVGTFWNVSANGDEMTSTLNYLNNTARFGRNVPVEKIILRGTSLTDMKVVGGVLNTYKIMGGKLVTDASYKLELAIPLDQLSYTYCAINSGVFNIDLSRYRKISHIATYDNDENVTSYQNENDILTTVIRDKINGRVIAEVVNATPEECAYSGFEENNNTGGWNYSINGALTGFEPIMGLNFSHGKTGLSFYNLMGNDIERYVNNGTYVVSFWSRSSSEAPTLNWPFMISNPATEGPDTEGWNYYEYLITNSTNNPVLLSIEGDGFIDELRLYPSDASMKTTSYNVDGTIRSECGVNNRVRTYLYDFSKRLEWTLDDDWQILTHHEYHIKNQNDPLDHSWAKEQVVMAEGMTSQDVLDVLPSDERVATTIQYSDGLGRPLQSLAVRQSPYHRDLVSFHVYDELGRESRKYLPFVSGLYNDGDFVSNPVTRVLNFYDGTSKVAETEFPYAEIEFEASPLNRALRQGNVGEQWQLNTDHTTKVLSLLNNANEVLLWEKTSLGIKAMNGNAPKYYPANTLAKAEVEDEHGVKMWEYTNALGQVVCKKARIWAAGPSTAPYTYTLGVGEQTTLEVERFDASYRNYETYFVYDDFGRIEFELPAIAIFECNGNYKIETQQGGINYPIFNGYITAFRYDYRGRQVEKKKPGEAWSQYVYNNLNQIILSKSPELSVAGDKWNYVKYDLLGRPVQTGFYTSTLPRATIQEQRDLATLNLWESKTGNATSPYNGLSFPVNGGSTQVLTETYYDDYNFDTNGYTYNLASTPTEPQGKRMRGAITGSKSLVLDGGNNYLTSVSYYDVNGRPAVQFTENILGGYDKIEGEFDYSGKTIRTTRYFQKESGGADQLTIVNTFEYDHAGRHLSTKQKIGNDDEVTLSLLQYNQLGQVVKKHLHLAGDANTGMQVVDYRYNERGWLTKINNADLANDGDNQESWDVFGEELIYHEEDRFYSDIMDMKQQFNGNIGAIKWKTNRTPDLNGVDMSGHSYVFRYDKLGQMTGAYYAASSDLDVDNYSDSTHMWDEKLSYLSNGNIKSLLRNRGTDNLGEASGAPVVMDKLTYSYVEHSNKVLNIQDTGNPNWVVGSTYSYSHFVDNNVGGEEYTYDREGRTLTDANKGLVFEYNHLDLVKRASEGSEMVDFIWDATGQKLAKVVGGVTTYYFGGIEYVGTTISHIATSEGIARTLDGGLNNGNWVYDYYLKDHLGNVRAVVTEENSLIVEEKVTVELSKRAQEDANFDNVSATEKNKPYLYPYDPSDPNSQKVSELSSMTGKIIGPAKVMAVKTGERLDLSTKYWYNEAAGDPLTSVSQILAGTLLNLGAASGGVIPSGPESGMALLNNVSGNQFNAFSSFIYDAFSNIDLSNPQAYIVYMYFDKNMNVVPGQSGIIQVGEANTLGQLAQSGIVARSDGFFYTYVTNRSEGAVYFDNLAIKHWAPMVRVTYDYYPYGLTWENPKLPTDPNAVHDQAYQGKEFQFAEFTTGHGLALYDFHARMYDPCTARWLVPDPAAQFANPYLAMGNNPVAFVDPDGQLAFIVPIIIGAVAGGFIGGAIQQGDGGLSGANWNVGSWDNTAWQGVTVGAIVGAGIGLAVSSGIAFAQGPISGISPGVSAGFSQFGTTTLGWDVTYNALMTANVNMASRALQEGGDWKNVAVSGLIGLAAGAIGGAAGASDKNFRNTMNLKGIRTQNYVTSILNGSGDRLYRSIDKGLNTSQIITNTIMGGMEGFIMAWTLSSEGFGPKNSNTFDYVKTDLLKNVHVNARDVISHSFARYVSGFLSQVGTSIPGVGFQVGTAYLMAVGGLAMGTDMATTIAAGVFLWGGATTGASAVFDWTGLWDSYEEIGGFRPYTVGGRNFN